MGVLEASLRVGEGYDPKQDPLPVVKQIKFAPPAICPVTETGSYPGVSMKTNPLSSIFSAYLYTSLRPNFPAF